MNYRSLDNVAVLLENMHQYKVSVLICKQYGILRKKSDKKLSFPCYLCITKVSTNDYIAHVNFQNDMGKEDSVRQLSYFTITIAQFKDAVEEIL